MTPLRAASAIGEHALAGKLRAIAILEPTRWPRLKDIAATDDLT